MKKYRVECSVRSEQALESVELIVNGLPTQHFEPQNIKSASGRFESELAAVLSPEATTWVAWRCFEKRPGGRFRFAHTAPWYFEVHGKPLRPRREEAEWFVTLVKEEIARSQSIAPASLIDDYRRALTIYEQIAATAQ